MRDIQISEPRDFISWDGRNQTGFEAPDATYTYRLTLSNECEQDLEYTSAFVKITVPFITPNKPELMDYTSTPNKVDVFSECCYDCIIIDDESNLINRFREPLSNTTGDDLYWLKEGTFDISARDKVQLGPNVVVGTNTILNLKAGSQIIIVNPVGIMRMSNIHSEIVPCD